MFDELTPDLRMHLQQALRSLFCAVYGASPSIRETTFRHRNIPGSEPMPQLHVRARATSERGAVHGNITGNITMRDCYLHLIRELHDKLEDAAFDVEFDSWVEGNDDV